MTKSKLEDWKPIRSKTQHFTDAELEFIRKSFQEERKPLWVARELQCSSRVIYTHYAGLRGNVRARRRPVIRTKTEHKKAPPVQQGRFYRSQFEPS